MLMGSQTEISRKKDQCKFKELHVEYEGLEAKDMLENQTIG